MTLLHFKQHSKISHKWVHPQTESAVSISYWLIMPQSYCTTHSKRPQEASPGWSISRRTAVVSTGSN